MFLNLSNSFNPYKASTEQTIAYEFFTFSGGEPHIKILTNNLKGKHISISIRIQTFNNLGKLVVAVDALKRMQIASFELLIPYFPAARQDRVMVQGEALTAKVYTSIINDLGAKQVTVFDPHSEVVPALLDNCTVIDNTNFIQQCLNKLPSNICLISPDGGALKKIYKLAQKLGGLPVVQCAKLRNVKTGNLSNFEVYTDSLKGKHCLIVDDICDGGRTFLGLAEKLKTKKPASLSLAISHGIFSRGAEKLTKNFKHIFSTDSFQPSIEIQGVEIIKLEMD